jgi:hypothetical protein
MKGKEEQEVRKEEAKDAGLGEVEFNIPKDAKWECEQHFKQAKCFYCKKHKVLVCPTCITPTHVECFSKNEMWGLSEVAGLIAQTEKKRVELVQDKVKKLNETLKKCREIHASGEEAKQKHQRLYALIKETMDGLTSQKSQQMAESDTALAALGAELEAGMAEQIGEHENAIEQFQSYAKKTSTTLQQLVSIYQGMQDIQKHLDEKASEDFKERVDKYMEDQAKEAIKYKEEIAKAQLSQTFARIHNENIEDQDEQAGSEFLYSLSPLATTLSIFDIPTGVARTYDLRPGHEKFSVPYGAATAQGIGVVYLTGGTTDLISPINDAWEYSLLKTVLVRKKSMNQKRSEHSMIVVCGELFAVGGHSESAALSSCEKCVIHYTGFKNPEELKALDAFRKPSTEYPWKDLKPLTDARSSPCLCAFKKDKIYAFCGIADDTLLNTIERLDSSDENSSWDAMGKITNFKGYHIGCININYRGTDGILLLGGINGENKPSQETYFLPSAQGLCNNATEHKVVKIDGCEFPEGEDFCNREPILGKRPGLIYVAGRFNFYKMDLRQATLKIEKISEASCDNF